MKNSDAKTRNLGIIALALALLAIISLIVSANSTINGSITKLPIIKLVVPQQDLNEFDREYEYFIDELEDAIENEDEDRIEDIEDEIDMPIKRFLKLVTPFSLNAVKLMAEVDGMDPEFAAAISVIITAIKVYAFILGLFVVLSAIGLNKGFFITATVLSAPFFFVFVGVVWFFIFLGLCIAYCILSSKVRDAYIIHSAAVAAASNATETENA